MAGPLKVAVLISGRGSNLQALIDAFPKGADSPVQIVLVLSNRPDAQGLERAAKAGLKTEVVDHKAFASREDFDVAMDREIRAAGAEFVVLAGFMRLLTDGFINAWKNRMINIHPALLPAFKGLDTHRRALEAGVKFHGCTVAFRAARNRYRPDYRPGRWCRCFPAMTKRRWRRACCAPNINSIRWRCA